jgi:ketosteroid isomerase-like protein
MKKTIQLTLLFAALLLTVIATTAQAQSKTPAQPRYKDVIGENPNAEADMKVVSDYVRSLASGDLVKAKTLLTDNYRGYGPSPTDSSTSEQTITGWQQNYKTQSNRKVNFITQTFRVKSGDLKGNWVSMWGDYSFTQNGKDVKFPFQYTARVIKGKIDIDRIYYDELYIIQTLGYKITPPENNK